MIWSQTVDCVINYGQELYRKPTIRLTIEACDFTHLRRVSVKTRSHIILASARKNEDYNLNHGHMWLYISISILELPYYTVIEIVYFSYRRLIMSEFWLWNNSSYSLNFRWKIGRMGKIFLPSCVSGPGNCWKKESQTWTLSLEWYFRTCNVADYRTSMFHLIVQRF